MTHPHRTEPRSVALRPWILILALFAAPAQAGLFSFLHRHDLSGLVVCRDSPAEGVQCADANLRTQPWSFANLVREIRSGPGTPPNIDHALVANAFMEALNEVLRGLRQGRLYGFGAGGISPGSGRPVVGVDSHRSAAYPRTRRSCPSGTPVRARSAGSRMRSFLRPLGCIPGAARDRRIGRRGSISCYPLLGHRPWSAVIVHRHVDQARLADPRAAG
jgi:hypothetical protein